MRRYLAEPACCFVRALAVRGHLYWHTSFAASLGRTLNSSGLHNSSRGRRGCERNAAGVRCVAPGLGRVGGSSGHDPARISWTGRHILPRPDLCAACHLSSAIQFAAPADAEPVCVPALSVGIYKFQAAYIQTDSVAWPRSDEPLNVQSHFAGDSWEIRFNSERLPFCHILYLYRIEQSSTRNQPTFPRTCRSDALTLIFAGLVTSKTDACYKFNNDILTMVTVLFSNRITEWTNQISRAQQIRMDSSCDFLSMEAMECTAFVCLSCRASRTSFVTQKRKSVISSNLTYKFPTISVTPQRHF